MTTDIKMHHATKAKYEKLQGLLAAEYPALTIEAVGDDIGKLVEFITTHTVPTGEEDGNESVQTVMTTKKVPEIADIFNACEDMGLDPEAIEVDSDTGPTSSIVPATYRKIYQEASSTRRSNGDWLAERLATDTLNGEQKLIVDDFTSVLERNGVDLDGKWAQARFALANGGSGRYRMNGRQKLEKQVALNEVYIGPDGTEHKPEKKWLKAMQATHAAWISKQRKLEEEAEEAIKEATAA